MTSPFTLPLDSPDATPQNAGGKGLNLSILTRAGYPVPPGFLLTTRAYSSFVQANDIAAWIARRLVDLPTDNPTALEAASADIRARFTAGDIPSHLVTEIKHGYAQLGRPPVAVRSSATAEDLPETSFAGQQDTFLNVIGDEDLLLAVRNCWSSLWTARAIGYRARNRIPHHDLALAVVVQSMVPAEASGVLFTANPLNGRRTETVIDATLGLGEALVSGQVEPDHYVVAPTEGRILKKTLGAKTLAIHSQPGGGLTTTPTDAAEQQALPDEAILALAHLGQRVAAHFDFPQDIEWAWANGELILLQSRPITSLFPLPEGIDPHPLRVYASFGAIQGVLDPFTPLGRDAIRLIFSGGASLLGLQLTHRQLPFLRVAAERLWVDISTPLRNPIGHKLIPRFISVVEPGTRQVLLSILDDPRLAPQRGGLRFSALRRFLHLASSLGKNILPSLLAPERHRARVQSRTEAQLAQWESQARSQTTGQADLATSLELLYTLSSAFPFAIPNIFAPAIVGLVSFALLNKLGQSVSSQGSDGPNLPMQIARGIPHNVTTQMDLHLWEVAQAIRADQSARQSLLATDAQELSAALSAGSLPAVAQSAIAAFLDRYGMRGVAEIDLGRPRWRQQPVHIFKVLQSYLRIEDPAQAPDAVFARGAQDAERAIDQLAQAVSRSPFGGLKARLVRAAARRFRALAGLRESPKFYIIRLMGVIHQSLLHTGEELVQSGLLAQPDDLFFLDLDELADLAGGKSDGWKDLVAHRRGAYQREFLRNQIPRLLLSDGQAFYQGIAGPTGDDGDLILGSPVSPGLVEGLVRVVLDPHQTQLHPGEILVCPGTDPAWTPLFLAAGGLVMEVGGMMTHGSVVAREYGIPAVVGVHQATIRLKTGQRIRLDGATGHITILDEKEAQTSPEVPA